MGRTIRLQGDSNAHDRPWKVAVERGFFADEGLTVEFQEDNPKGVAGRVQDFSQRWKESQLQKGDLEVYPVCEWGAIEGPKIIKSECVRCDDCERLYADTKKCPHWLILAKKKIGARLPIS